MSSLEARLANIFEIKVSHQNNAQNTRLRSL